ncbi:MAG: hypothetical protein [Caudoviricetes sp.]|nr:MAG: hypothetical protein [Caudoviricetes sp.]
MLWKGSPLREAVSKSTTLCAVPLRPSCTSASSHTIPRPQALSHSFTNSSVRGCSSPVLAKTKSKSACLQCNWTKRASIMLVRPPLTETQSLSRSTSLPPLDVRKLMQDSTCSQPFR